MPEVFHILQVLLFCVCWSVSGVEKVYILLFTILVFSYITQVNKIELKQKQKLCSSNKLIKNILDRVSRRIYEKVHSI